MTDAPARKGSLQFPLPPTDNPFAAAFAATRMPMLVTDPGQVDNPIIYVNQAFTQLTGYTRKEILGMNCRFLQGPGTNQDDVAKVRKAIEDRQSIEIDPSDAWLREKPRSSGIIDLRAAVFPRA